MSVARRRRRYASHEQVAEWCRAHPGQWYPLGLYNASSVLYTRRTVEEGVDPRRDAATSPWQPVGAFEMRTSLAEFQTLVEVRLKTEEGHDDVQSG